MKIIEVAEILKVHPMTVKRWIKKGKLKATMIKVPNRSGGHDYWDITKLDIDNYLNNLN